MSVTQIIQSVIYLAIAVLWIAGMWRTFSKAGKPGWAAIIPIYNFIVMSQVAKKPVWWGILCLVPVVNVIFLILISMEIAVQFDKGKGWGFGLLVLLPFIGYPLLGFTDAKYKGSASTA